MFFHHHTCHLCSHIWMNRRIYTYTVHSEAVVSSRDALIDVYNVLMIVSRISIAIYLASHGFNYVMWWTKYQTVHLLILRKNFVIRSKAIMLVVRANPFYSLKKFLVAFLCCQVVSLFFFSVGVGMFVIELSQNLFLLRLQYISTTRLISRNFPFLRITIQSSHAFLKSISRLIRYKWCIIWKEVSFYFIPMLSFSS